MNVRCPRCGLPTTYSQVEGGACPACRGLWEIFPVVYLGAIRAQDDLRHEDLLLVWGEWLTRLPAPSFLAFRWDEDGLGVFLATLPNHMSPSLLQAWSAQARHHMRLDVTRRRVIYDPPHGRMYLHFPSDDYPRLSLQRSSVASLASLLQDGRELRIWILGPEPKLQRLFRDLAAYHYGSRAGVDDDAPNVWAWRLALHRGALLVGGGIAALGGGVLALGNLPLGLGLFLPGLLFFSAGLTGELQFLRLRSIPREYMERAAQGLIRVVITLHDPADRLLPPPAQALWEGPAQWLPFTGPPWPQIRRAARPLAAQDVAALVVPTGEVDLASLFGAAHRDDAPAARPSRALVQASLVIGRAVATQEPVGIDPDAHGLIVGGSGTGKSSAVYTLLEHLLEDPEHAPGLFLVDPHLSLADAFLTAVDALPSPRREAALRRLIPLDPTLPMIPPLNLLTLPRWDWAVNALITLGRRIWKDYWGPRMQSALQALFRMGHGWNRANPHKPPLGLGHLVFIAFNRAWRHQAMGYLPPTERMGNLILEALLGQMDGQNRITWITEVVSPIVSKVMALELSPWLFAALHQERFVAMDRWIRERAWIVLRPDIGQMGRPAAEMVTSVVYNVFDSVFRTVASPQQPVPYYVIVDEAQEVADGMRMESALSEGRKFGLRIFLLTQSITMLRMMEDFGPVVQALLANTSTQMVFSFDPDDREVIERLVRPSLRYGQVLDDLPTLTCWLRARVRGRWQPPTLVRVDPLPGSDPHRVRRVMQEAVDLHQEDFVRVPEGGDVYTLMNTMLDAMLELVPPALRPLLERALEDASGSDQASSEGPEKGRPPTSARRRLGL